MTQSFEDIHTVCVIVAHPDDETLWAGGTILLHPEWDCKVFSLCRASELATQSDLLYKGLQLLGVNVHAAHFESAQEKEWYYRWFEPDVVVCIGYWGHTPQLILHPQRYAQDGRPMGQDWQTWSAALYLYAAACVENQSSLFFDKIREKIKQEKGHD